jgi:hypothetical protein
VTTSTSSAPRRLVPLRIGLVLAALLGVFGLVAVLAIGFDGSSWDAVQLVFTIVAVVVAVGCLVLLFLGWNGRRGPAIGVIVLQALSIIPALPAFFLPAEETADGPGPIAAIAFILLSVVAIVLVALGSRPRS